MSVRRKQHGRDGQQEPADSTPKKPTIRVIPGVETVAPSERRPAKIRVVGVERLTPQELKKRFASNLDRLMRIIGLSRKDAAQEVGIPYKLMRRLASAGVSCTDERNIDSLTKIARHFALPSVEALWWDNLLRKLLTTDGRGCFREKFRERLLAERERRLAAVRVIDQEEVALVGGALGVENAEQPPLSGSNASKVAAILASPKADNFQRIIDDYYELIRRHVPDPDEDRRAADSARA